MWIMYVIVGIIVLWAGYLWAEKARKEGFSEGKARAKTELSDEQARIGRMRADIETEKKATEEKLRRLKMTVERECDQLRENAKRECDSQVNSIERKRRELAHEIERVENIEQFVAEEKEVVAQIVQTASFDAVAHIIADAVERFDLIIADLLQYKQHAAPKAAEKVREYSRAKRVIEQQMMVYKYRLLLYEELFPWITEFNDRSVRELVQDVMPYDLETEDEDPVRSYLSDEEWFSMTENEKNQRALERYIQSHKKTRWQIGRDYEMYIAHLFRKDGYEVECPGTSLRFDDLGRDIIVRKGNRVRIIQCKYWSKEKIIHEKHVFQLFGTCMCYQLDHPDKDVACVLVTNTKCSMRTHEFAKKMGVLIREDVELGEYPRIKCHISSEGERIYHLPMDQQYDKTVIDAPGEFYAFAVHEAVAMGFRRAYRWRG